MPYGTTRSATGTLDTDKLFTGQRLDDTGLYFYNARYYDATIGRFISADTIVQNPANPQSLNRYSYCLNNPLKYIDPSGYGAWDWLKRHVFSPIKSFVYGIGHSIKSAATGAWHAIRHPGQTFQALDRLLASPDYKVASAIWKDVCTNANSAYGWGKMTGDVLMFLLPTKGLDNLGKLGTVTKLTDKLGTIGNALRTTKALPGFMRIGAGGGKTVLGKHPNYINVADDLGARRFNVPTNVWEKMSLTKQWSANQKFLDRAIARGDEFVLANPVTSINEISGSFRRELDYLISKGYQLSTDGTRMIK